MRVALFITCFNDTLFPETGKAVVRILERLGVEVDFPVEQTCCGQLHSNTGYGLEAVPLVRRFVRVFADAETIVTPSGSCAAMVVDHYERLAKLVDDERLAEQVKTLIPRVHEFSSFVADELGVEDVGARFPHRVVYHPACHATRMMRVGDAPLRLLRAVQGLELVDLEDAATCCGFGGTFSVKNAAVSTAMMSDKLTHIVATGAEVCTAVDNSCLMHIGGGLRRLNTGVDVLHLAQILDSGGAK
ncbi:MAG: (Fe-S)-binding protein [Solirubrobacteraceae bacterium]